jgi:multiple sugar transport system permease protein
MTAPSIGAPAERRDGVSSRPRLRRRLAKVPIYLMLTVGAVFALIPFVWMLSTALKTPGQLFKFPPEWIPNPIAWTNFGEAWDALPFGAMVLNSIFVTTLAMAGELASAAVVAYGFARFDFRFRNTLFLLMLSTMMLPWVVTLIPGFLIWKQFGLINTFDPLTVGALFAWGPFYVFLLRQFFLGISKDIEDAAIVDGANTLQVLWYVMLPLVRPVLLAVAVLSFQGNWNNFKGALIYLQEPLTRFTLPLGLQFFQATLSAGEAPRWHLMMAMSTLMVIPVMVLFFLAQRQFIEGIQLGGVKG